MENKALLRVVCLFGTGIIFDKTLSVLLDNGVEVVGVCNANKHKGGVDFSYLKISAKKQGYLTTFKHILGKVYYKLLNSKKDKAIFEELYDENAIKNSLRKYKGSYFSTDDYQNKETLEWIKSLKPDLLLIHTGYWVGKKVRNIVNGKCLGGHPGITPDYRGVHSPFWAIYNGEPEKVGYSVFWVDGGVDTGDILFQDKTPIAEGDSYITLSWKGMIEIANHQAKIIKMMESGTEVPSKSNINVLVHTNYTHPTLGQYLKYRRMQKTVR